MYPPKSGGKGRADIRSMSAEVREDVGGNYRGRKEIYFFKDDCARFIIMSGSEEALKFIFAIFDSGIHFAFLI